MWFRELSLQKLQESNLKVLVLFATYKVRTSNILILNFFLSFGRKQNSLLSTLRL